VTALSFPPDPSQRAPRVVTFARAGACVYVLNAAGRLDPMMVLTRCRHEASLFCVSCQLAIANLGNLEMHVEAGGAHELIRWCKRHGCPEGPNPGDVERVAAFQQIEAGL
jgi:hypothetical protein